MKETILAKRYADAFLGFAKDAGLEIGQAVEELASLKIILYQNPDFYKFLDNVEILDDEKYIAIDRVLKDFSEESRQFLKLLLDKGRIKELIDICDYVRVNYTRAEAVEALLKTSYPLSLDLIRRIKEGLEKKFKKNLNLHIELDADLLGGIQATVGNTIIDGSVRRRLADLREKLITVRIP